LPFSMSSIYVDANGGKTIHRIRTTAGAGAILADLLVHSNADFFETWESSETANLAPAPVAAAYQQANTAALLQFVCVDFSIARLRIPAPKLSIFFADGATVNGATINALIAACIGTLVSTSGSPAVSFIGGVLEPISGKDPF